jgi:hypothetical protein
MDFIDILEEKYPYMTDDELELLIIRAKSICVEQMYPANLSINYDNFDWTNKRYDMWILDCVDELVERLGMSSVVAYKENNMGWSFDRAGVSQALLDRLPRMAKSVSLATTED